MATADALKEWHDFYVLLGTASATLIAAMFVVASIGGRLLSRERAPTTRLFITPTIVHLSGLLLACVVAMLPALDAPAIGWLFGAGGLGGLAYAGVVLYGVRGRSNLVLSDTIWYSLAPALAYAAVIAAAAMMLVRPAAAALDLLAAALLLLLVGGIRNAWDLILFMVAENQRRAE